MGRGFLKDVIISVIIPTYNAEKYIKRCLESVFAQTYKNYEVIVIDDGSTDTTKLILEEFAERYAQLRIYSATHLGVSAARNKGLEMSQGDYIAFVDADDEISPYYLETLYNLLQKYQAQISVCGICHVYGAKKYSNSLPKSSSAKNAIQLRTGREFLSKMEEPLRYEITAVCWNKLYHKDVFANKNYPLGRIYEDSAMIQEVLYPLQRIAETGEVLYFYHTESDGITRTAYSRKQLDEVLFAKKRMLFFRDKKERELYILARKQYCIALLKHYYLSRKTKVVSEHILMRLRQEQKRYLKGFGWKKKLSPKVSIVFEAARYAPYICGAFIVWWDKFLEKKYRTKK